MENSGYKVDSVEQLQAIVGQPHPFTSKKVLDALDEASIAFIRRSSFIVIGTADAEGNLDTSPKGDGPGFVEVQDEQTLLIPERKGNKLMYGFRNILANPNVGIIFMVPGTNETLRVNGTAELTNEPAILNRLVARGAAAILAARVTVKECFFHCAKAFIRSQLWAPETWPERQRISFGKLMAAKVGAGDDVARKIDEAVEHDYKNNL
jgi:PPOX class probable FMN-dependent enzyme